MARKFSHYVVWKGRTPGVYTSWDKVRLSVDGYPGAEFKGFTSRDEAYAAFKARSKVAVNIAPKKIIHDRSALIAMQAALERLQDKVFDDKMEFLRKKRRL